MANNVLATRSVSSVSKMSDTENSVNAEALATAASFVQTHHQTLLKCPHVCVHVFFLLETKSWRHGLIQPEHGSRAKPGETGFVYGKGDAPLEDVVVLLCACCHFCCCSTSCGIFGDSHLMLHYFLRVVCVQTNMPTVGAEDWRTNFDRDWLRWYTCLTLACDSRGGGKRGSTLACYHLVSSTLAVRRKSDVVRCCH